MMIFYPGMKISVSVNFVEYNPKDGNDFTNIYFNANRCGHSNVSANESGKYNYSSNKDCIRIMNIYQSQCESDFPKIHSKVTDINCTYNMRLKTIEKQFDTFSHEIGHVMGLADAYQNTSKGRNYELLPQFEYDEKEVMNDNSNVSINDIEMLLYHHFENGFIKQKYTPVDDGSKKRKIIEDVSPAFRAPYLIYIDDNNKYYVLNNGNFTGSSSAWEKDLSGTVLYAVEKSVYIAWKTSIMKKKNHITKKVYKDEEWYKKLP